MWFTGKGGFHTIRHNEIHDFTQSYFIQVPVSEPEVCLYRTAQLTAAIVRREFQQSACLNSYSLVNQPLFYVPPHKN